MILGGQDKIISNAAAMQFYQNAKIQDKNIITFDDTGHEILNDKEYFEMIVKDMLSFFNTHS